jgi:hypothetical protein
MLEQGFTRVFGRAKKSAARAALGADKFPFSGYARWQINDRWDVLATRESSADYAQEARALSALAKSSRKLPPALAASLRFRHYLAQRDWFVRHAAQSIFSVRRHPAGGKPRLALKILEQITRDAHQLEQELTRARAAARVMWRRSRDARQRNPNEEMLACDAQQLRSLRTWLRRAQKNLALVRGATPLCGAWQLQFTLHNFAPAVQKVVVEQQQNDDSWKEIHSLFTIEFKAVAARPRAGIVREISAPVDSADARLRLAVRGTGQVVISQVSLTNGIITRQPPNPRKKIFLGQTASSSGFPFIDWTRNSDALDLNFAEIRQVSG